MSTHCNIAIRLKDKDINRAMKSKTCGRAGVVISQKRYLQIYSHYDGYPKGVGSDLNKSYPTYKEALDLILAGDCRYPGDPFISYPDRNETWDNGVAPLQLDNPSKDEEYLYVFEDDEWHIK